MKQHLDLSTPCFETAGKNRHGISVMVGDRHTTKTTARLILLSFLHLPLDHQGGTVCHACNNHRCLNPLHLYLGTQKDNIHDQMEAGTFVGFRPTKGKTIVWKCTSPDGVTIFKVGLQRVEEHTGIPKSAVSIAAKKGTPYRGWSFQKT